MADKVADLKGLKRFKKKVQECSSHPNRAEVVLRRLCEAGMAYAKNLYGDNSISVTYSIDGNGNGSIIANGERIAYLEYGTGEQGRGSYEGNLPTQDISFYSTRLGQDVTVDGWTYSYAHEFDSSLPKWKGSTAKAQMWTTARWLRDNAAKIIREVAKE